LSCSLYVWLYAKLYAMAAVTRRARRPDSLAASVVGVLDDVQCPVPTDAMRVILVDGGRAATAEHLARVAAYEREDWLRSRMPPRLCSVIDAQAVAVKPRWWARGDWRLERRIMTEDVKPIWFARMAERLCLELADRIQPPGSPITTLALACIARAIDVSHFDVPTSSDEWLALRQLVYGHYLGAFHNLAGATAQQHEAEAVLTGAGMPAVELYFGRAAEESHSEGEK
jgi:hypothetical protein